ncbi:uridine phosphorylase [Legionella gresilensis]|uniref:phosphorylase family protein n=1 Tax=Legionella gresilensis TaxID=91823 RepID=UPI0010415A02|nr:uridine phosphorylase [Legionella gresilensis]
MDFEPKHINATPDDLKGNNGLGRYIFLTGSDERAKHFSERFSQTTVRPHPRQHNLYLGTLLSQHGPIDVGAVSSGMGGPSADIIISELINLGTCRFLRVGTAGSLQPEQIKTGHLVVATGAVRDDKASWDYIYPEYPALSSLEYLIAAGRASKLIETTPIHFGVVHSKSSLYAREFHLSIRSDNEDYMSSLHQAGVLASEMECAQLFILTTLKNAKLNSAQSPDILSGCILAIVGDKTAFSDQEELVTKTISASIDLSIKTIEELFLIDQKLKPLF